MKKMIIKKYLLVATVNSLTLGSSRVLKPCHKLCVVSRLSRPVSVSISKIQTGKSRLWLVRRFENAYHQLRSPLCFLTGPPEEVLLCWGCIPVPAGQVLWCQLWHWRQVHSVQQASGRVQILADVESTGNYGPWGESEQGTGFGKVPPHSFEYIWSVWLALLILHILEQIPFLHFCLYSFVCV